MVTKKQNLETKMTAQKTDSKGMFRKHSNVKDFQTTLRHAVSFTTFLFLVAIVIPTGYLYHENILTFEELKFDENSNTTNDKFDTALLFMRMFFFCMFTTSIATMPNQDCHYEGVTLKMTFLKNMCTFTNIHLVVIIGFNLLVILQSMMKLVFT